MVSPRMDGFFKRYAWLCVVAGAMALMTIPRVVINYGFDGDAARSAQAAEQLFETGTYQPSRMPGNPLFEYLLALVVPWGRHIAANLFVFVFYLVSIGAFWLYVRERDKSLLLIALFSLTPIVLVNAASTMDYIPGLALLMSSYAATLKKRYVPTSILLGLSIGFRLTNGLFLLPLILYLAMKRYRLLQIVRLALLTAMVGCAFYLPVFIREGFHMFDIGTYSYRLLPYLVITIYKGLMLFGPLATAGVLLILLANGRRIAQSLRESLSLQTKAAPVVVELTTVALFVLVFVIHSDETAYLIPAIPFFYLLLARWLSRKQLILVGILIVSFAFFTIEFKGGESGRRTFAFEPAAGVVLQDHLARHEMEVLRNSLGQFDLSDKAVILTGLGAILTYQNHVLVPADYREVSLQMDENGISESANIHRLRGRDVFFVYALSQENVVLLKQQGFDIYIFSEAAPSIAIHKYRYDPYQIGIERLDILNEEAFYRGVE